MKVLIACEFSGRVRDAFARHGHNAWSCDLLPSESPGQHIIGDVLPILGDGWDILIAHPPCTHLARSGARHWARKQADGRNALFALPGQQEAIEFFMAMVNAPVPRICVENPISCMSSKYRRPDQIIQPWQFGHGETKATCLWLKNLPPLVPTCIVEGRLSRVHNEPSGPEQWKARSRTYEGIANAMGDQWGRVSQ